METDDADAYWKGLSPKERHDLVADAISDDVWDEHVPTAGRLYDDGTPGDETEEKAFDAFWATEDWGQFDSSGAVQQALTRS